MELFIEKGVRRSSFHKLRKGSGAFCLIYNKTARTKLYQDLIKINSHH